VSRHSVVLGLPGRRRDRHKSRTRFYNRMMRRRIRPDLATDSTGPCYSPLFSEGFKRANIEEYWFTLAPHCVLGANRRYRNGSEEAAP
jgi:hypothetical protein